MSVTNGPNLGVMVNAADGDAHGNQFRAMLRAFDGLVQAHVKSRSITAQPGSPTDGDMYIIPSGATGASWSGQTNKIARYSSVASAWEFFTPKTGWEVYLEDEKQPAAYNGSAWDLMYGPTRGFKNYLINGDFAINQRAFAGGALAAGVYGHDRWKADTGGANYSVSGKTVTITSGTIVQVIESPNLANQVVTISVNNPSGSISVNVDGQTGTITAGSGRRGVSFTIAAGSTGNITVKLGGTSVSFSEVQLELGGSASSFEWRPAQVELALCHRYFFSVTTAVGDAFVMAAAYSSTQSLGFLYLPVAMRVKPTGSASGSLAMNPGTGSGTASITAVSTTIVAILVTQTSVTSGSAGYYSAQGSPQTISLNAEL